MGGHDQQPRKRMWFRRLAVLLGSAALALPVAEPVGRRIGAVARYLLTMASQAQAQTLTTVLVDNSAQVGLIPSNSNRFLAQAFTTGNNTAGYTVTSVWLSLSVNPFASDESVSVVIRADNNGEPGDLVATLVNPDTIQTGNNRFTTPVNTVLEANTTYWLSIHEGVSNRASVLILTGIDETGLTGWSIANTVLYRDEESSDWESPPILTPMYMSIAGYANLYTEPAHLTVGTPITPVTPSVTYTDVVTSYSATGLPPGLMIDPTTGVISGTPIRASDSLSTFVVTVTDRDGASAAIPVTFPQVRFGVSVASISVSTAEGGTATYTLRLGNLPLGNVTITPISGDSGALAVSPASLTFTPFDWHMPRTVTVTGVADDDPDDETVTIRHNVSGARIATPGADFGVRPGDVRPPTVAADVTVSVADDDILGVSLCDRTPAVRSAILEVIDGITDCGDVSVVHLNRITTEALVLRSRSLSSLQEGDFADLANLQQLLLDNNDLSSLPEDIFTSLTSLQRLWLYGNELSSLPAGIFNGLTDLQQLYLDNNHLSSLPGGIFNGLASLQRLWLYSNELSSLPAGIFNGLDDLQELYLEFNNLSSLDEEIFADLSRLERLRIRGNGLECLPSSLPWDRVATDALTLDVDLPDCFGVSLSVAPAEVEENDSGQSITVSATLSAGPRGRLVETEVTVSVTGGTAVEDTDFAAVDDFTITIPSGSESATGTFTLAATADTVAEPGGETVLVSGTASSGNVDRLPLDPGIGGSLLSPYSGNVTGATVLIKDDTGVDVQATTLTVREGSSGVYTLVMDVQPTGNVTVTPISSDSGVLSLSPASLTFTTANWDTARTVMVTGVEDADASDETAAIRHRVSGAGSGTSAAVVTVTVTDDDVPVVSVCERTPAVRRAILQQVSGITDCADVSVIHLNNIILLASNRSRVGSLQQNDFADLSKLLILFLSENNLSDLPEGIFDGLSSLSTLHLEKNSLTSLDADVFAGASNLTTLFLERNSLDNLDEDLFDGLSKLKRLSLEFNSLTSLPEAIFAAASNLQILDLENNSLSSLPADIFAGLSNLRTLFLDNNPLLCLPRSLPWDRVAANTLDLDVELPDCFGVSLGVTPAQVDEGSGGEDITVSATLTTGPRPTSVATEVAISVAGATASEGTDFAAAPTAFTLTIPSGSESATGTFTLTATVDTEEESGGETVVVSGTSTSTLYPSYAAEVGSATVTINDALVSVWPIRLNPSEGGTAVYTVTLKALPDGTVTVVPTSGDSGAVSVSPASLTFTTANWDTTRTVSVAAVDDDDARDETVTIRHSVSGYGTVTAAAAVTVRVVDGDEPGVGVRPTRLRTDEGETTFYTVTLSTLPAGTVTITPANSDSGALSLSPASLTFTTANWNTARTVSVTGVQDDDPDDETVTIRHDVSGYGTITAAAAVTVNVDDDDPGASIQPTRLISGEGGTAVYTVILNTLPPGAVTVAPTSSDSGALTVSPASLTFTTTNWDTPRTVTVAGVADDDAGDETVTVSHSVSGYGDVTSAAVVTVTVTDDEAPEVRVEPTRVRADEAGTAVYTVTLGTLPDGAVTITPTSGDSGAVSVAPASLTFTTANWNMARTVTVTGVADDDLNNETATIGHSVSGYGAVTAAAALTVSVTDDDVPEVGVCERTPAVRNAILQGISGITDCADVSVVHLNNITTWLLLNNFGLSSLKQNDFDDLSNLQWLYLDTNSLSSLPDGIFDDLSSLRILSLLKNSLSSLDTDIFADLSSLVELYLDNNSLSSLDADIFNVSSSLTRLYLDSNQLSSLDEGIFTGLSNLQELYLDNNQLSSLDEDIFNDPTNLQRLFLDNNQLSSLPDGIFTGLTRLGTLTLSGNPLLLCLPRSVPWGKVATNPRLLDVELPDCFGVSLSVTPTEVTEGNGGESLTVSAVLTTGPRGRRVATEVTVSVAGDTAIEGMDFLAMPSFTITIPNGSESATGTFTLTATADAEEEPDGKTVRLSGTAMVGAYAAEVVSSATVTIKDGPVRIEPARVSTDEGGTATYTVTLNTLLPDILAGVLRPGPVTIIPSSGDSGAVTVSPASLVFAEADRDTPQTVTVTGVEDDDAGDETVAVSHSVSGAATIVSAADVTVNVTDDDAPVVSVCDRTPAVQRAILRSISLIPSISGVTSCEDVSVIHLNRIKLLSLNRSRVGSLQQNDFADLSRLFILFLSENNLSDLPEGIFDGLSGLSTLHLEKNSLTSLPEDVFAGASNLTTLYLERNSLTSLPEDLFDGLSTLRQLSLEFNSLTSLPEDVFAGPSNLETLYLENNSLTSLPADIFDGLSNLRQLRLRNNPMLLCLPRSVPWDRVGTNAFDLDVELPDCFGVSLSVTPRSVDEGNVGDGIVVTATLTTGPRGRRVATEVAISVAGDTASEGMDFAAVPRFFTITIPSGSESATGFFLLTAMADTEEEPGGETVRLSGTAMVGDYAAEVGSAMVTINDAPVSVRPLSLSPGEGETATYTLTLRIPPDNTVTIIPTSGDSGAVSVAPASLVFTTANWDTPQTLTVTTLADEDGNDETVTVRHDVSGYGAVTAAPAVTVRVSDSEDPGVEVQPARLGAGEGETLSYTVTLSTLPAGNVTVTPASGDSGAVTVAPASLTFTTSNWNTARTVTVTALADDDPDDEMVTIRHGVSGYAAVTAAPAVTVTVADDDPGARIQPTSLSTDEGGTATYTVVLNTLPAGNVTVTPVSGDTGALAVSTASLTFTTTNWDTAQTVTVTGVEDADGIDETVTVSHSVSGYGSVSIGAVVTVSVSDDEAPGVRIQPTSLRADEGGAAVYTMTLNTQPAGAVTITPVSGDSGALTVSPTSLTFTPSDWNTARTVTVTGRGDDNLRDETVIIGHSVSGYGSLTAADAVTVIVTDDDVPAVSVCDRTPAVRDAILGRSGIMDCAQVSVVHLGRILALPVGFQNLTTLQENDFADLSGLVQLWLMTNSLSSLPDGIFNGLSNLFILFLSDNPGISLHEGIFDGLSNLAMLRLDLNRLSSLPEGIFDGLTNLVYLYLNNNDLSSLPEDVFAGLSLLQELHLTENSLSSLPDSIFAGLSNLQHLLIRNNSLACLPRSVPWDRVASKALALDVDLPDCFGVSLSVEPAEVEEDNGGQSIAVSATLPAGPRPTLVETEVTISVTGDTATEDTDFTAMPSSFTITIPSGDERGTGTFTLTATADTVVEPGGETVLVSGTTTLSSSQPLSPGDPILAPLPGTPPPPTNVTEVSSATVLIRDDTVVTVLPTRLTVGEGGSEFYTLVLDIAPTGPVTIIPTGSDSGAVSVSPASMTFTTSDWDTPRTVTVAALEDDDPNDETVTLRHSVSGYGDVTAAPAVTVTVTDDDVPGVEVQPTHLRPDEGGTLTYTVTLNTPPAGDVTVTATGSDSGAVSMSPASMTFTTANWDTAQTVTVTGVEDDDPNDEIVSVRHSVSGYGDVTTAPAVTVIVNDDDLPRVELQPTTLSISEGGTATYTVMISTLPAGTVTITLASGDSGAVSMSPASLTFTPSNWNTPRTVAVTGVEDEDFSDETVHIRHLASGGYGLILVAADNGDRLIPMTGTGTSIPVDVVVSVADNTPGAIMQPTRVNTDEGGTATYTVMLNTLPPGAVTITPTSGDSGAVSVSPASLTFTTANWNTAQTVSVAGVEDSDVNHETVTISHSVSGYGAVTAATAVTVTVSDDEAPGVRVQPANPSAAEGGTAAYIVTLNALSAGTVTITPTSSDSGAVSLSPNRLTFTTSDWSTARTVTVTGVADDDLRDETVTIRHSVSGYGAITTAAAVTVTVTDDDVPVVSVCERTPAVRRAILQQVSGITDCADVSVIHLNNIILLASNRSRVGSLQQNDFADLSKLLVLFLSENNLSDLPEGIFDGLSSLSTLHLERNSLTSLPEDVFAGASNLTTLFLERNSLGNLDADLFDGLSNLQRLSLEFNSLTSLPEAIFAAASNLQILDLENNSLSSLPADIFAGLSNLRTLFLDNNPLLCLPRSLPWDRVAANTLDLDVELPDCFGVSLGVTPAQVDEGNGGEDITVTATLTTGPRPTSVATEVAISVAGATASEGTDFAAVPTAFTITIPSGSESATGTFTLTATVDTLEEAGGETVVVSGTSTSTLYPSYAAEVGSATVTINDALVSVWPIRLNPSEGGTAVYTVTLKALPDGTVTVVPTSGDSGAVSVSPASLTFTTANWDTTRTVTVTGVADDDASNETVTVRHDVSGYGAVTSAAAVMVTVTDDDDSEVEVEPTRLSADEGGTAVYTLRLSTRPAGNVTITPASSDSGAATVSPASVVFTTANWDTARTVIVTGVEDDDVNDETVIIRHSVSGYGAVSVGAVVTISVDDDDPGAAIQPTTLSTDEGGSAVYTVTLSTLPPGAVTIVPTSSDSGALTVSPARLTFTTANWDTARTLTVTGVEDADAIDETVTVSHSISGYGAVTAAAAVTVTVSDDEAPGVRVQPTRVSADEAGTATYTVTLYTQPAGAVTITPTSGDSGALSVTPASLTFTTSDWNTARTVTVTGVADDDAGDETVTIRHNVSGYATVTAAPAVTVDVTDDDVPVVGVCERTPAVRRAILRQISGITDCADVSVIHLNKIIVLASNRSRVDSLKQNDFADLSNLFVLFLSENNLSDLPEGIFDGLSRLSTLHLEKNSLTSLPEDVFAGASNLTTLFLDNNLLDSLPEDLFDGLSNLRRLSLERVSLTRLPEDIFVGPSNLEQIYLENNALSSLPADLFAGLSNLTTLFLDGNPLLCLPRSLPWDRVATNAFDLDVELPDCFGVSLSVTPTQVEEGNGGEDITVTATLTTGVRGRRVATEVAVSVAGDTASDTDFVAVPRFTITIPNGSESATGTFTLTATADAEEEPDETVVVSGAAMVGDYAAAVSGATVTIQDSPVRVHPTNLSAAEGGTVAYTVTLRNTRILPPGAIIGILPHDIVTITITPTSGDSGAVTVSPARLTFNASNWNTPQTLTVTALEDDDPRHETVTIRHGVSGYGGIVSVVAVTVTVNDDEAPMVNVCDRTPAVRTAILRQIGGVMDCENVSMMALNEIEEILLGFRDLSSLQENDFADLISLQRLALNNNALSSLDADIFADFSNLQELYLEHNNLSSLDATIFAGFSSLENLYLHDNSLSSLPEDIFADLSNLEELTLRNNGLVCLSGNLPWDRVTDGDLTLDLPDCFGVSLSVTPTEVEEGTSGESITVTATLSTGPRLAPVATEVTISITGDTATEGTDFAPVSPFTITIPNRSESATGTFTLTATADAEEEPAGETVRLSGTSILSASSLPGTEVSSATVTIKDGPVRVQPARVSVAEGGTATYIVTLRTQPAAAVTVTPSSGDSDVLTVASASLTFTTADWNTARTVTVAALEDDDPRHETLTVSHGVSGAGNVVSATAVTVIVTDDDAPAVSVCDRTPAVRDTILRRIGITDCADVSMAHLNEMDGGLYVEYQELRSLRQNDFADLFKLETLDLDNNSLSSLPDGIFNDLSSLTRLDLDANSFTSLPDGIFNGLSNLEWLDLEGNSLTGLPDGIFNGLSSLEFLYLEENRLLSLDADIFNGLSSLIVVWLSGSDLSSLPEGIFAGLSNLNAIDLSNNRLTSLPEGIFAGLSNLRDIWLSGNRLSSLPDGIFNGISNLRQLLVASNNNLVCLPRSLDWSRIGTVPNAIILDVDLPDCFGVSLSVTPTEVEEGAGGESITVTATLSTGPRQTPVATEVTISLSGDTATEGTDFAPVSPFTITIPNRSESATGTFTLTATTDAEAEADGETVVVGGTSILSAASVPGTEVTSATVTIKDGPGVSMEPTTLTVDEGGSGVYTLVLNTDPGSNVTVTPTSGDSGALTVSPASLTFTPSNWDTARTLTVTGVQDNDGDDETVTVSHSVSGYGTVSVGAAVTVSVTDDDTPFIPPMVVSATLTQNGGGIVLTLSEATTFTGTTISGPLKDAFTVTVDGEDHDISVVLSQNGREFLIQFSSPVAASAETVVLSYDRIVAEDEALADADGNLLASFRRAVRGVGDTTPPTVTYTLPDFLTVGMAITPITPATEDTDISNYSAFDLPDGLTINTTSGEISGTPTTVSAEMTMVEVTVTDLFGNSTTVTLAFPAVGPAEAIPPMVTYTAPTSLTVGTAITPITPATEDTDIGSYSATGFPAGLMIDPATGVISGTPTTASTEMVTVVVTVTDRSGNSTRVELAFPMVGADTTPPTVVSATLTRTGGEVILVLSEATTFTGAKTSGDLKEAFTVTVDGEDHNISSVLSQNGRELLIRLSSPVADSAETVVLSYDRSTAEDEALADANGNLLASFKRVLRGVGDTTPPTVTYTVPTSLTVGVPITAIAPHTEDTDITNTSATNLPAGLMINPTTGVISGTPTTVSAEAAMVVVTVMDLFGNTTTVRLTFPVVMAADAIPLMVTYAPPASLTVGTPIIPITPTIEGADIASASATGLPAGLMIDPATGVISGTPTTASTETSTVVVTVTDRLGSTATITLIFPTVGADATPPTVVSVTLLQRDRAISLVLSEATTFTGAKTSGPLKDAFTVTVDGENHDISVVLSQDGRQILVQLSSPVPASAETVVLGYDRIVAEDEAPADADGNLLASFKRVLRGSGDTTPPTVTYTAPTSLTVGTPIPPIEPDTEDTDIVSTSATGLPAGLMIDPTTGVISGTPTTASAETAVVVVVTDLFGNSTTVTLTFPPVVPADAIPPMVTYAPPASLTVGTPIAPIVPTIEGADIASASATGLPAGLMIDPATGVISGTPTTASTETAAAVVVTVTDRFGSTTTVTLIFPTVGADTTFPTVVSATLTRTGREILLVLSEATTFRGAKTSGHLKNAFTVTADGEDQDIFVVLSINGRELLTQLSSPVAASAETVVFGYDQATAEGEQATAEGEHDGVNEALADSGGNRLASFKRAVRGVGDVTPPTVTYTTPASLTVGAAVPPVPPITEDTDISTYSATGLPAGLTINRATGEISGTPTTMNAETATVEVSVTDLFGNSATVTFTFPAIEAADPTALRATSLVRQNPAAAPTNADSLTWRVTFSEAVTNVDATDFTVSGSTATVTNVQAVSGETGVYDVTVSGGDLAGLNGTVTLGFASDQDIEDSDGNVLETGVAPNPNANSYLVDNTAPTVTYAPPTSLTVGITIPPIMPDIEDIDIASISATGLPDGLIIDTSTGEISGTPTTVSTALSTVVVTVTDNSGNSATVTLTFPAAEAADPTAPTVLSATLRRTGREISLILSEATTFRGARTSGDLKNAFTVTADGEEQAVFVVLSTNGRGFLIQLSSPVASSAATVVLRYDQGAAAAEALEDADGNRLASFSRTIREPLGISVADTTADENDGVMIFQFSLDRASQHVVQARVRTTEAGTATPGQDFQPIDEQVLTFAPGEMTQSLEVTLINDAIADGGETIAMEIVSAEERLDAGSTRPLTITDGTAFGVIENADPLPVAWLSRFGRTVAQQVVDVVARRGQAEPTPGLQVSVAGESLDTDLASLADNQGVLSKVLGFETVSTRQLVEGTAFALSPAGDTGGFSFWGEAALSSFEGEDHEVSIDGEQVFSTLLGGDWRSRQWQVGAALAHSSGSGAYRSSHSDAHGAGEVESRVTGLYPYAHYGLNPQLSLWGVVGYGRGALTLTPDGGGQWETALTLSVAALGMEGLLRDGGSEGLTIKSSADALWVRTSSDAADGDGEDGAGRLEGSAAEVSRLRLGLQASRAFPVGDRAAVTPSLEIGLRQDGGDAETGFGLDMGAGLLWADGARGLSAELKGRALLSHGAEGFQDEGFAASLAWDPAPSSERGPSLSLSQTMGGAATGGMEALLSPVTMEDVSNGSNNGRQQFEARLAYGLPVDNNRLTLSPVVVLSLDPSSRITTIGWSLSPEEGADPWQFSMEAQRQESNSSQTTADHELEIRFSLPF